MFYAKSVCGESFLVDLQICMDFDYDCMVISLTSLPF
jgi:hypothetical protein